MGTSKHLGGAVPKRDEDLRRNPGIGQSKGGFATGEELEDLEGNNTTQGDVENDPDSDGKVNADRLGRTNK